MAVSGAPARAPRASVWPERIGAALAAVVLTAILTYPTVRDFGSLGRFDTGDGRFSIWNVAWVAHALVDDPLHLFDANIFHPHRYTLTYSELNLVAGVFATPVYAMTRNPVAAHNSAIWVGLVLAFLATWGLTRRLTGSPAAALVAATGYTFSAYTASHTAHIQLLTFFGFPLSMLAFHRMVERPTAARGAWLGAALAVTALACGYYGIFAGGLIALAVLFWARFTGAYWKAVAVAVLVLASLVLPVLLPYARARQAAGASRTTTVEVLRSYSANWRDYVTSGTLLHEAGLRRLAVIKRVTIPRVVFPRAKEVLFPGVVMIVFAVVGLAAGVWAKANRRAVLGYALIGALAVWASFGPDAKLYSLMMKVLPFSSLLRAPARLGIIVIFAIAVLAAFGFARLSSGRRWLLPVCLAALVAELWVPWPVRAMPPLPRAYELLARVPRGGVVELPFAYIPTDFHQHTRAMVRSIANWQPLLNGYSDFIPADFKELALPINGFPDERSFEILRQHDVRYVIVRLSDYSVPEYRQRLLERFPPYDKHLRRLTAEQDVWLYEIVSWP